METGRYRTSVWFQCIINIGASLINNGGKISKLCLYIWKCSKPFLRNFPQVVNNCNHILARDHSSEEESGNFGLVVWNEISETNWRLWSSTWDPLITLVFISDWLYLACAPILSFFSSDIMTRCLRVERKHTRLEGSAGKINSGRRRKLCSLFRWNDIQYRMRWCFSVSLLAARLSRLARLQVLWLFLWPFS